MHKIFGIKESENYIDRKGAYLIPVKNNTVAVVQTPKGYFLLGGGIEGGEGDVACIERECLEEIGYRVKIDEHICSAESYTLNDKIGYFHPIQNYYTGELVEKSSKPIESDHKLVRKKYDELIGHMFSDMQGWAIEQAIEHLCK